MKLFWEEDTVCFRTDSHIWLWAMLHNVEELGQDVCFFFPSLSQGEAWQGTTMKYIITLQKYISKRGKSEKSICFYQNIITFNYTISRFLEINHDIKLGVLLFPSYAYLLSTTWLWVSHGHRRHRNAHTLAHSILFWLFWFLPSVSQCIV